MSNKNPTIPHEKFVHSLKENYAKRIDEVDAFSKRFANMCVEVNTEILYGCLDVAQNYLDLQKKFSAQYPGWFNADLLTNIIKQNTEAWIQGVQNIDTVYIDSMKNMKNNLRSLNKNSILFLKNTEKVNDIYEKLVPNQENESDENTPQIQVLNNSKNESNQN